MLEATFVMEVNRKTMAEVTEAKGRKNTQKNTVGLE